MKNIEASLALAAADFSKIACGFADAGFDVCAPVQGILQIRSSAAGGRLRLLLSAGIHGDETAPIEMLAHLLGDLARRPNDLQADLMIVIGNLAAIAQRRRYLDADLNRMFVSERGDLQAAAEAGRADAIMLATAAFFGGEGGERWHVDLHTAIRESHYPVFAVIPDGMSDRRKRRLIAWLGGAGIGAVILNAHPAPTFSACTATRFGACSCTLELGRIGILGENDLDQFAPAAAAIGCMLRSGETLPFRRALPAVFRVEQEIVKRSDDFQFSFDRNTRNFTAMEPNALIAQDAAIAYRVGPVTQYMVFPNPDVRIGQRAGLMVVRHG